MLEVDENIVTRIFNTKFLRTKLTRIIVCVKGECVYVFVSEHERERVILSGCFSYPLGLSSAESSKTRALKERLLSEAELTM